jgi:hypothetical protein
MVSLALLSTHMHHFMRVGLLVLLSNMWAIDMPAFKLSQQRGSWCCLLAHLRNWLGSRSPAVVQLLQLCYNSASAMCSQGWVMAMTKLLAKVRVCVCLLVLQRRRKNRKGKLEPKVKVESAVVDMATGKTPTNPVGEAEGRVLQAHAGFFGILLVEGLLLSGAVSATVVLQLLSCNCCPAKTVLQVLEAMVLCLHA